MRLGFGLLSVTLLIVCIISLSHAPRADAAFNKYITITRSDSCEKSNCIKIRDLYKYDNSTKSISGKFYSDKKTGDYYRKPGMKNSFNYYNIFNGKLFVFVTPDSYTQSRSKEIIIVPYLGEYATTNITTKKEIDFHTTTRTTYAGVHFNPSCDIATVSAANRTIIPKVIAYLASDCAGDFGHAINHTESKKKIIYCGIECQHEKFMKKALEDSKKNLLGNRQKT